MSTKNNYITGHIAEFNEFRDHTPMYLESGGFMLCTAGSGEVAVDSRLYTIKECDLIVAFPHSYVHAIRFSDDFDGVILGVDIDTLITTSIPDKSFYITQIAQSPSITLSQSEADKILKIQQLFAIETQKTDHPFRCEIDEAILKVIIYEIASLFRHSKPNSEHRLSRDKEIFNTFVVHLNSDACFVRQIEHFAQKQSITASHLSKVVKRISQHSASEWISDYTIANIKRHLQDRDTQIATIAERLGFPNASFMSQYFKARTGQSPKEYRHDFFAAL